MMQLASKLNKAPFTPKAYKPSLEQIARPVASASFPAQSCFLSTFAKRSPIPVPRRSFATSSSGKTFERKPTSKSASAGASTNQAAAAAAAVTAAQAAAAKAPAAKAPRTPASRAPSSAAAAPAAAPAEAPPRPTARPASASASAAPKLTRASVSSPQADAKVQKNMEEEFLKHMDKPLTPEEEQEIEEVPEIDVPEVDQTMPTAEKAEADRPVAPEVIPAWKPVTTQDFLLEQMVRKPTVHTKAAFLKTIAEAPAYMIVSMDPEQYAKAKEQAKPDGSAELDESSGVSFHSYGTTINQDVIPLFTAKNRAIGYWERCDFEDQEERITLAEVSGFDVLATAAESKSVLFVNPYAPVSCIIPPAAAEAVVKGKLDEAAKLTIAARLPESVALSNTSRAASAEMVEPEGAFEWRTNFMGSVQRGLKANLQETAPIRIVGIRMEKLQHTQLLHPDTQVLQYVLEVVVDPPGAETEAERKIRADVEQQGQEIPLTREELYESSVVSSLTTLVEAEHPPPRGVALWVTPVKQLSDESALVFRRATSSPAVAAPAK